MKKNNFIIIGTSIFFLFSNFSSAKVFTDIRENDNYYIASRYLSEKEVINGYTDGTFKPNQDITRAELLKIIFEGNKTPTSNPNTNCFPDVGYQEWYSKYICTAKNSKIISGYEDGNFKPNKTVNKAEALKILGEFYKWEMTNKSNEAWYSKY
ncbi:S-layer homology domain-containing protein, partial [Candidatus Gracilibacteria bacterium]|nr:S-layer homology domain-containing protein [Candidatus Gracilibacteria bacterium]